MLLRGTPLLIALLLHLLVALLYWALMPMGMNWYRDHFGFASHRDIGLGIAQFHLFWMFIGAQPLIAVLRRCLPSCWCWRFPWRSRAGH